MKEFPKAASGILNGSKSSRFRKPLNMYVEVAFGNSFMTLLAGFQENR
jgi:hypothetical protein